MSLLFHKLHMLWLQDGRILAMISPTRNRKNYHKRVCSVCAHHLNRCKNFCFAILSVNMQGELEPICLSCPTKLWHFGGWVVWSTTCNLHSLPFSLWQGAKPRTPTTEKLAFTQLSQSEIFFGVVFNLICMVFLQSWRRAKPRTLQRLFSISGTLSVAGLTFSEYLQLIRNFHRRDLL